MRYSMAERHSYGNGFRKARAIGLRKLRHQRHTMVNYYNGKPVRYSKNAHDRSIPRRAGGFRRD